MTPIFSAKNITFSYDTERQILQGVNLELNRGEVLCILGSNGCGKSTLMRTLINAHRGYEGTIELDGTSVAKLGSTGLAKRLAIVFQEHSAPFPFTVFDVIKMGRSPHMSLLGTMTSKDREIVEEAMELVGVTHMREKPYTQISGGERQLVLIARAIAQKTDIILLDEPTSHLDFRNQARILKIVHNLAKTHNLAICMTTHLPDQALIYPSTVALMHGGKFIAYGPGEEVLTDENLLVIYKMQVRVLSVEDELLSKTHRVCIPQPDTI